MADAGKFLARWSRLKGQARKSPPCEASEAAATPGATADAPPAELPPVASLTAESDYTLFMRPGVPEATRNAALQKLWRSDPVFANLDGLVEYGEDYAAAFKVSAAVRTAYRIAQGMGGDTPPNEGNQPTPPTGKSPTTGAASPHEPGTEPSSDRSAKDSGDMHEDRAPGWTDA